LAHAVRIQADNFAVENGALRSQSRQRVPQYFEALVCVSATRDQAALPILDVGHRAKANQEPARGRLVRRHRHKLGQPSCAEGWRARFAVRSPQEKDSPPGPKDL
jgi:hypothetical protein